MAIRRMLVMRMLLVTAAIVVAACGRAKADEARAEALAAADRALVSLDSLEPFGSQRISVGGESATARFDVSCTDARTTAVSLLVLGAPGAAGPAFLTTSALPNETPVAVAIDGRQPEEALWELRAGAIALAPMPVSLGQQLLGARELELRFQQASGEPASVSVDLGRAQGRLRQVAQECRWPHATGAAL